MAQDEKNRDSLDSWVHDVPWLGMVVTRIEGAVIVRANEAFLDIIGYTAEDLATQPLTVKQVTLPQSSQATTQAAEQLRSVGRMHPIEKTYVRKDGGLRRTWVTGVRPGGDSPYAITYVLDVTEQHTALEALRESEDRARRFSEASFEGLYLHDRGLVLDTNDVLPVMFRTTREGLIGRTAYEFTDPSCHELMRSNLARQYELPYELIGKRVDGTLFPIEVLGKPLLMGGKQVRVTAVRDLTERKRAEAELRQAEAALREAQKMESLGLLAGGVAHDFNNLLTIVLGAAAVARREAPAGSVTLEALSEIERAAKRAADLTRQMLVYSGRSHRTVGDVDLGELVRDMVPLLSAPFPKKIRLDLTVESGACALLADRAQVQQVLMNLVTNAAEAIGDEAGQIRVETRIVRLEPGQIPAASPGELLRGGEYAKLEVSDTGCGMDEATLARIFDPFFSTKATGRGLGLSALLGILRGHRAGLTITTHPGEGTTFCVYFPLGSTPSQCLRRPAFASAQAGRGAVLVVDDEASVRRFAREMLASAGYLVLEARNGNDAVDVFSRHTPDVALVLLDLMMPEADGRDALAAIRKLDPDARVVLSSGFDRDEVLRDLGGKVQGFLPKPYQPQELLDLVASVIGPARRN